MIPKCAALNLAKTTAVLEVEDLTRGQADRPTACADSLDSPFLNRNYFSSLSFPGCLFLSFFTVFGNPLETLIECYICFS